MILSLGLLSLLLSLSQASPVSTTSTHAFDLGPLDSCSFPTTQQLGSCSGIVNYEVPSVLLSDKILAIKHKRIAGYWSQGVSNEMEGTGNGTQSEICGNWILAEKCRKEFPPCHQTITTNKTVSFSTSPCSSHPCMNYEPSCGQSASTTVSLTSCHAVTSFDDYTYNYCSSLSGWSTSYITKWMHVLLQEVENDVFEFENTFTSELGRRICLPLYAELLCGSVGRCSEQGTRAELNATREVCTSLMNCVGNNQQALLAKFINCSNYISVSDKEGTMATPITDPTTAPLPTTEGPPVTDATSNTMSSSTSQPPTTRPGTSTTTGPPVVTFPEMIVSAAPSLSSRFSVLLSLLLCIVLAVIVL